MTSRHSWSPQLQLLLWSMVLRSWTLERGARCSIQQRNLLLNVLRLVGGRVLDGLVLENLLDNLLVLLDDFKNTRSWRV